MKCLKYCAASYCVCQVVGDDALIIIRAEYCHVIFACIESECTTLQRENANIHSFSLPFIT